MGENVPLWWMRVRKSYLLTLKMQIALPHSSTEVFSINHAVDGFYKGNQRLVISPGFCLAPKSRLSEEMSSKPCQAPALFQCEFFLLWQRWCVSVYIQPLAEAFIPRVEGIVWHYVNSIVERTTMPQWAKQGPLWGEQASPGPLWILRCGRPGVRFTPMCAWLPIFHFYLPLRWFWTYSLSFLLVFLNWAILR